MSKLWTRGAQLSCSRSPMGPNRFCPVQGRGNFDALAEEKGARPFFHSVHPRGLDSKSSRAYKLARRRESTECPM
eukprot:12782904-Alexandrium_andersonii.AAC.1